MLVEPRVEKPTRDMLDHAIKGELGDLAALVQAVGNDTYRSCVGLCLVAAGYIAIDVSGMRWPSDVVVQRIAHNAASAETRLDLSESDIYNYLSRGVLGFENLDEALGSVEAAASLPVLITASMLFTFRPQGQTWWEYLDTIWNAVNAAEGIDLPVFPALMLRVRRIAQMEGSTRAGD
jgi:hypothetical protein